MDSLARCWRRLRRSKNFEQAVDAVAADLQSGFEPPPSRLVGVLLGDSAIQAIHTVPLADRRRVDGVATATISAVAARRTAPFLASVEPSTDGVASLAAGPQTRDGLLQRDTRALVVCPLLGQGATTGFLVWEFGNAPSSWQTAAECACALSQWLLCSPPAAASAIDVDQSVPVAGPTMTQTLGLLSRFSREEAPLLLRGESGVGKTRLAQWIHTRSRRSGGPLQHVNLLTIEENLRAAHLFGTRKGAFTDAIDRAGLVALADGGTLFIDEVDKLTLSSQAQLLELLDSGTYRALGASDREGVDIRVLTGSNADLRELVDQGLFLEDLYRRIAALPVHIPPLRERREDIVPWARWFLSARERDGGSSVEFTAAATELLERQRWPGNLRTLAAVVTRSAALCEGGVIDDATLRRALSLDGSNPSPLRAEMERAASSFVDAAEQIEEVTLGDTRVFQGVVLAEAVRRHGKRRGFEVLGEQRRVEGDNHHKKLREETQRTEAFWNQLQSGLYRER